MVNRLQIEMMYVIFKPQHLIVDMGPPRVSPGFLLAWQPTMFKMMLGPTVRVPE